MFRHVTYKIGENPRVFLTLRGDWVITGGLSPNINTASVPYTEFDKLPSDFGLLSGDIEFWDTTDPAGVEAEPDHVISLQRIVNVAIERFGREPGDLTDKVLVYNLSFADSRDGMIEPRGGCLFAGRINPDPTPTGYTLRTNSELMADCLAALGMGAAIVGSVDDVEPMREIRWDGEHAGRALADLIEHTGHVYAQQNSGLGAIVQPGYGIAPTFTPSRIARDISSPLVDRRGSIAVFISSPAAEIDTWDNQAATPEAIPRWRYVARNSAGVWQPLATIDADFLTKFKQGKLPDELQEQAYRCIQLSTTLYPPGVVSILNEVLHVDGTKTEPCIRAKTTSKIAVREEASGTWSNKTDAVVKVAQVADEGVLVFDRPIGRLAGRETAPKIEPWFEPLTEGDTEGPGELLPEYSVERYADGERVPSVFGFNVVSSVVTPISESTARSYLIGWRPNVCIYRANDLQVVRYNGGEADNYDDLQDRCETYAAAVVAGATGTVRTVELTGFYPAQLGSQVSEIRYSQAEGRTTVTIGGWRAAGPAIVGRRGGGVVGSNVGSGEAANGTSRTGGRSRRLREVKEREATRARQRGTGGEGSKNNRAKPTATAERVPQAVLAKIVADSGIGRYSATTIDGKLAPDTGDLDEAELGTAGTSGDCEVWFLGDLGAEEASLAAGSIVVGFHMGVNAAGKPIIVCAAGGGGGSVIPAPGEQYQVLMSLGGGEIGWRYPQSHA